MSSIFRRLPIRRRSNRERSKSLPIESLAANNCNTQENNIVNTRPEQQQLQPPSRQHEDILREGLRSSTIDAYEERMEELGQLMSEQGAALDEMNTSSRRLSTENQMLRERLSQGMVAAKPAPAPSTQNRSPLKNIMNNQKSTSRSDDELAKLVRRMKDENALLVQQADLLANELADANRLITERDASIAILGKELDKSRSLMAEKKDWKTDMFQKTKDLETLQANAKRSNTLQSEASQRAEQYLAERKELEAEVTDLGAQMNHLVSKVGDLNLELSSKQREIEQQTIKQEEMENTTNTVQHEVELKTQSMIALQDVLQRTKLQGEKLELKLKETRDKLAENQISRHKLKTVNGSLREEVQAMVEKHKAQISSWTKSQSKALTALKEQHLLESQTQQKLVENLQSTNSLLECESAQCKRDLQSVQRRCSALEKLLATNGVEHTDVLDKVLRRATEAETRLEASQDTEKELKSKISTLEKKLVGLAEEVKDVNARHGSTIEGLQTKLLSLKEENHALSKKTQTLEDELETLQQQGEKERQQLLEQTEHKIALINIECKALRVSKENERLNAKEKEELLHKQARLHESTLNTLAAEKEDLNVKLERVIVDEREVGKCLMLKVQSLNTKIQTLAADKLRLIQQTSKRDDQIYQMEQIIIKGEAKLSQFGKQLSRSMEDQERRIMKEVELKREMNTMQEGQARKYDLSR